MSELRYDPFQGRWVIIATDRSRRPGDLQVARPPRSGGKFCPFCPGNESRTPPEIVSVGRPAGAAADSPGWQVRVIPNRYPALSVEGDLERKGVGLFDRMRGVGAHEVVISAPDHAADLASLSPEHLTLILQIIQDRLRDLYRDRRLKYVLAFENHGAVAGATLAHAHSQIIATPIIPRSVGQKLRWSRQHFAQKERCLFCDVMNEERDRTERMVHLDPHFVAFTPYASRFPFELMIMPRRHQHHFAQATGEELLALARCLSDVVRRLHQVLENPPYNLLLHTAPNTQAFVSRRGDWETLEHDFHWHIEILPRLTQVAGFETGTDFYINPTAPEEAARFLRDAQVD